MDYEYENEYGIPRAKEFVQCRQAAEWGMRTIGLYKRLSCKPLPTLRPGSDKMRKLLINTAVLLNNYKVSHGQGSQISTVYLQGDNDEAMEEYIELNMNY